MSRPHLHVVRSDGAAVRARSYGSRYAFIVVLVAATVYALLSWVTAR